MSWSYDTTKLNDPTLGPLMQIRLVIGDTDTTDQQLQDEEIDYHLTQWAPLYAAAACADSLVAKYSRQADRRVGQMSLSASQRAKAYQELAARLRRQAATGITPYAGGISVSDKQTQENDTDRVSPAFWSGMQQNLGAPNPTDRPIEGSV